MNKQALNDRELQKRKKEEVEAMRETVIEQELSARSWKAFWEKMYYTVECEKIQTEYDECKARMEKKVEDQRKAFEEFKKNLAIELEKKNQDDPNGAISIEGFDEQVPEVINQ